jgi:DNA replicative helicase MCM subunit Mcm2 (Cdc46/Mcm family)
MEQALGSRRWTIQTTQTSQTSLGTEENQITDRILLGLRRVSCDHTKCDTSTEVEIFFVKAAAKPSENTRPEHNEARTQRGQNTHNETRTHTTRPEHTQRDQNTHNEARTQRGQNTTRPEHSISEEDADNMKLWLL